MFSFVRGEYENNESDVGVQYFWGFIKIAQTKGKTLRVGHDLCQACVAFQEV